jgi:hypothetical protein
MNLKRSEMAVPVDKALTEANTALVEARKALDLAYAIEPDGAAKVAFCQMSREASDLSDAVRGIRERLWAVKASNER